MVETAHLFGVLIKSHMPGNADTVKEWEMCWKSFENGNSLEFAGGYLEHQQWTLLNMFVVISHSPPIPSISLTFGIISIKLENIRFERQPVSQNNHNVLMDFIHWNADDDDDDNKRDAYA